MSKKEFRRFLKQKDAKVKVSAVVVMMTVVALSSVLIMIPQDNIVKAASTTDFDSYQLLTIEADYIDSTLTNFPVLVYNSSWETGLSGTTFSFFQSDNSTECNWELEEYNSVSGELIAWVNVSSISSSTDTTFYLYYDDTSSADGGEHNPTGTWDSKYVGVYHMDGTSDSTSYSNDGTLSSVPSVTSSKIGDGYLFDGSDDYIDIDIIDDDLGGNWPVTISAWSKISSTNDDDDAYQGIVCLSGTSGCNHQLVFRRVAANPPPAMCYYGALSIGGPKFIDTGASSVVYGDWSYLTTTVTSGDQRIYRNGIAGGSDTIAGSLTASSYTCVIGAYPELGAYAGEFEGYIDEVRIYNGIVSAAYVKADFNSVNSTTGFLTFGTTGGGGGTTASSFSLSGLEGTGAGGNGNITWTGEADTTVWSNATSYGTLNVNHNVNASDNCTECRIYMGDLDASVDADCVTLYVSSDNSNFAVLNYDAGNGNGIFPTNGGNLTINETTWPSSGAGTNPFPVNAGEWVNGTVYYRFKLAIPVGVSATTFTQSDWKVWWKVES